MTGMAERVICCRGLRKAYGEKEVLYGIGLEVRKGEIFGFLGPSGAGKTTLVKILTGQITYQGEARVLGKEAASLSREEYRRIGILTDDCGLYDRLSVFDNLQLFARLWDTDRARIPQVLTEAGLDGTDRRLLRLPAGKLSKGMRQRMLLARLLLQEPELLFLDEPTSGLDPAAARYIQELLLTLGQKETTIFLTTHNMEEAQKICDRVALLHQGEIVETGAPDEMCRRHNTRREIRVLRKDGEEICFGQEPKALEELTELLYAGQVETIHSTEPDLGSVFLKLTGKELEL